MQFEAFDYMAWAKAHQGRYRHDLSVSGMPPPEASLLELDPAVLTLAGVTGELRAGLRAAIAREYGVGDAQVVLAAGTSEANFLAYALCLQPGDAVLAETPVYQVLTRMGRLFGAETFSFARSVEDGYALDMGRIKAAWRPNVKLVAITTPHNPTGFTASIESLRELGEWLERHDAYAVVDEVYRDFIASPPPVAQAIHPRLITTASLTKVYGLGALRAGWALMPEALARRAEQLYDYMAVNPAAIPWRLALAAFSRLPTLRTHALQRAAENRVHLARWLASTDALAGPLPPDGIVALLRMRPASDAMAWHEKCRVEHELLITPGDFFDAPGWLRVAYGAPPPVFAEALACLGRALAGGISI